MYTTTHLNWCFRLLLDSRDYLEAVKKRSILRHVFGKARISARLLELEKALQDSYNALLVRDGQAMYSIRCLMSLHPDVDRCKYIYYRSES